MHLSPVEPKLGLLDSGGQGGGGLGQHGGREAPEQKLLLCHGVVQLRSGLDLFLFCDESFLAESFALVLVSWLASF